MGSLNRYKIAFKALSVGSHDFEFEVGDDLFGLFEASDIQGGSGKATIKLNRQETHLQLDVNLQCEVQVECDRCLDLCSQEINYAAELLVKFSDEVEPGEYDGDILWLPTSESELDLSQYLYESILLSLPYQRVHPDGECNPDMIERFRIISGEEFEAMIPEGEESSEADDNKALGDFRSKLMALKEQMESEE